ncbi:hypothetical protein B484DRAFT_416437, partial [Ochromonadaceae sp. CCMP2298]
MEWQEHMQELAQQAHDYDEEEDDDSRNEGRDEDDDEDERDVDEEHRARRQDEEDGDDEEVTSHLHELRRQALIQSLIGMGFPVEWALRAAQNCDVTTSESAAITWIIERMETEQSKMDELEADSNRAADEEDFEDGDGDGDGDGEGDVDGDGDEGDGDGDGGDGDEGDGDGDGDIDGEGDGDVDGDGEDTGLDYFMQRHAAAFHLRSGGNPGEERGAGAVVSAGAAIATGAGLSAGGASAGLGVGAGAGAEAFPAGDMGLGSGSGVGMGMGMGMNLGLRPSRVAAGAEAVISPGGSPTREEVYIRRGASLGEGDGVSRGNMKAAAAAGGKTSAGVGAGVGAGGGAGGGMEGEGHLFDEVAAAAAWNVHAYALPPPVLAGHYVARHRHDQDKQEVLTQVVELDLGDMLPIIVACEFSLCVYYARAVLLRAVGMGGMGVVGVPGTLGALGVVGDVGGAGAGAGTIALVGASANGVGDIGSSGSGVSGSRGSLALPMLTALLSSHAPSVALLFKICFKQHLAAIAQPDRLLPLLLNGNCAGDARDRVPPLVPFASPSSLRLNALLSRLELRLFPQVLGTLAVEEGSVQALRALSDVLDVVIHHAGAVAVVTKGAEQAQER